MTEWKPISISELYAQIQKTETDLNGELWNFWQLIKIDPTKWAEKEFGITILKTVSIFQTIEHTDKLKDIIVIKTN